MDMRIQWYMDFPKILWFAGHFSIVKKYAFNIMENQNAYQSEQIFKFFFHLTIFNIDISAIS